MLLHTETIKGETMFYIILTCTESSVEYQSLNEWFICIYTGGKDVCHPFVKVKGKGEMFFSYNKAEKEKII